MAGLTTTGLVIKRLDDIRTDLRARARQLLGPKVQLASDTVFGQLIDLFSIEIALVWSLLRQVYDAFDPESAEGEQLDNVCTFGGLRRLPATKSVATQTLLGDPGTVVPLGTTFRVDGGPRFLTQSEATIGPGGTASVTIAAEETGPIEAPAGTITTIVTPVSGLDDVTNAADAVLGRNIEKDEEFRQRREESLQIVGAGPDQAIRARLEQLANVQAAVVISNREMTTDANGIPPKDFLPVIWPATVDPASIIAAIWGTQPAGIDSHGSESGTVIDGQGYEQDVSFSYATELAIYVEMIVSTDTNYPADGDDQIAAAVLAAGQKLSVGDDVLLWKLEYASGNVPGILTIEARAKVGSAPGVWDTTNLPVSLTEIARFDSARITVTHS